MTQTNKLAKLIITKAVRADTGRYVIRLENSSGTDTADCEVIVLGPPSKPRGPLDVKGVTKSTVTLAWSPPADNGGRDITFEEFAQTKNFHLTFFVLEIMLSKNEIRKQAIGFVVVIQSMAPKQQLQN